MQEHVDSVTQKVHVISSYKSSIKLYEKNLSGKPYLVSLGQIHLENPPLRPLLKGTTDIFTYRSTEARTTACNSNEVQERCVRKPLF